MKISYKGKTVNTKNYVEITDEERERLKQAYFAQPDFENVKKQMKKISKDGVMNNYITDYYFKDIMAKVQIRTAKWTIEDLFNCNELLGMFKAKTLANDKVFPSTKSEIDNIMTAVRLGGKGYVKKPTKFPVKTAKMILDKYNLNNNYYDFSCGWGDRLIAALSKNINYYGTDPNSILCERLIELDNDWHNTISTCTSQTSIYSQGSEIYIPQLQNKIGLAFSSPPYFDLEDYKIGDQSYKTGMSYDEWLNNYMVPTFKNIYEYLIVNGYLALNIKNTGKYNLVQDAHNIISSLNFNFIGIEELKNNRRITCTTLLDCNEGIFIYQKV